MQTKPSRRNTKKIKTQKSESNNNQNLQSPGLSEGSTHTTEATDQPGSNSNHLD